MSLISNLGPYVAGEKIEPWLYVFRDAAGTAMNLSGFTAKLTYKLDGGTQVVRDAAATTDGSDGSFEYAWVAADIATAGRLAGEMWVGNGTNRYARSFVMTIDAALGGTAPSI